MDRLDRLSIWVIVVLIISSVALVGYHNGEAKPEVKARAGAAESHETASGSDAAARITAIKKLMDGNNVPGAEALAKELLRLYPYEGEAHMLLGDVFMRRQEPVKAVFEYRDAVDLNPDFLDKKTALFQGKKIKIAVGEALTAVEIMIKTDPGSGLLKKYRKDIYYLQRRIAGSCG